VELVCDYAGSVTGCYVDTPTFTLAGYDAVNVGVDFSTGSSGTGTISLRAQGFDGDSGWRNITVQGVSPPTVTQPRQADSVFNRTHCLTTGAALGSWSCGDGLLFLSTPSVTTLQRARNLTLVHATNTVAPFPLVMAEVKPALAGPTLNHVTAVLTVRDTIRKTAVYSAWGSGPRQLVLGWDAANHATGAYPYSLTVRAVGTGDSASTTVSGLSFVVNRSNSPYGKGWEWLSVERLVLNQPVGSGQSHIMWVGGDGSAKLYRQATSTIWVAPLEMFPDTITFVANEYVRRGRHNVQTVFSNTGKHIRTINRTNHVITFYWNGELLDSVRVPPAGSSGRTLRMRYSMSKLDSVIVATGKGVNVTVSSGLLSQWAWPDGTSQSITSDGTGRPTTTADSRGSNTRWIYGTHGLLTEARSYFAVTDSAVVRFTPWQAAGFATAMGTQTPGDTANAVSTILGPRVGVNDDAVFHVDKWGAVTEVRDALGVKTKYRRENAAVPALVTRVDYPNSRRVMLEWNTRSNLTKMTDSTWGARAFPKLVTAWAYASSSAPDSPTQVTGPAGDITTYAYTTLGLTDSIIDPRGHRTKFVYGAAPDSVRGQIVQLIERAVPTWKQSTGTEANEDITTSMTYFPSGNVRWVTSPSGGRHRYGRDADGRVVSDTNAVGLRSTYTWDAMDRQTHRIVGRGVGGNISPDCLTAEFTCADLIFDALNPTGTSDTTRATYTQGFLAQLTDPRGVPRSYRYDLRGLMTAEIDEAGVVDSARYDAAGLLLTHRTRLGINVTNSWDVADRLTKTVIPGRTLLYFGQSASVPADSVVMTYDSLGNVLSLSNRNGVITRSYYETGHLKSEAVVPVSGRSLADSSRYAYDSGGRLRSVAWVNNDSVTYRYTTAGDLDTMRVYLRTNAAQRTETWRFAWDGLGRRRTVFYPFNSMTANYRYDRLGTLRRLISDNPGAAYAFDRFEVTVQQDSVDVLGRVLSQKAICPYLDTGLVAVPCRDWLPSYTSNRYNRLGALAIQERLGTGPARDTTRYDRSGNLIQRRNGLAAYVTEFSYPALSNRIAFQRDSAVGDPGHSDQNFIYDAAGNRIRRIKVGTPDTTVWQYDALSRLVGAASRLGPQILPHFNECRWDAAWRLAQPCGNGGQLSFMGENVARSSLGWFFVQAPGIDETVLLVDRSLTWFVNKRLQAVTDGRGQLVAIADSLGDITGAYAGAGYDQAAWKAGGLTSRAQTYDSRKWETNSEWGGIQQFRNRAYDPATGTWIQEDPIGASGGINQYRYNGSNPVGLRDPMGLTALDTDTTYVNCRSVGGDGDGGIAGHCAFRVVNDSLGADLTFELVPNSKNQIQIHVSGANHKRTLEYTDEWVAVSLPADKSEYDFDLAVLGRAYIEARAIQGSAYTPTGGGNSNRFVFNVIDRAGGRVPRSASAGFLIAPGICGGGGATRGSGCQ
jgi:RHS repeat-associated protein